jgi:hypothetical protein
MFAPGWAESRICRENFHRTDPLGDDSVDADRFYSWGALIPAMQMLEAAPAAAYPRLMDLPQG